MDRIAFAHRAETFGLDKGDGWAADTLRLLYNVPRVYDPLVGAWERHHPGTKKALRRLVNMQFVARQGPVIVDTRTGQTSNKVSRTVRRYRTTAKGQRLIADSQTDLRIVENTFARTTAKNIAGVLAILEHCDLDGSDARFGLSGAQAASLAGLNERTGRWWIVRLIELGMLRELDERVADVREVIPAHWRPTRILSKQLQDVLETFDHQLLAHALRLNRSRYLDNIDPARVGVAGATDYDHDVHTQRVLAAIMNSPQCVTAGNVVVEPRHFLPVSKAARPWAFDVGASSSMFYQPDAELRERNNGRLWRCVVEYERYQTRRDGWNHIERFLGYAHTRTLAMEPVALRFVVDSQSRLRSYVELIEAFADWSLDHPELMPANDVTLAVAESGEIEAAKDALAAHHWLTVSLNNHSSTNKPVVHPKDKSPYDSYFSRG